VLVESIVQKKGSLTPIFPDEKNCDVLREGSPILRGAQNRISRLENETDGRAAFQSLNGQSAYARQRDDTPILMWLKQEMKKQ